MGAPFSKFAVTLVVSCVLGAEVTDSASAIVGGSFVFIFARSARAGEGRAREAVDESIGVAVDEDITAGTDVDLIIFARRAVRSATEVIIGSAAGDVTVGDA